MSETEAVVLLMCNQCGGLNRYRIGEMVQRGCDRCCCDWFTTAEECPHVHSVEFVTPSEREREGNFHKLRQT